MLYGSTIFLSAFLLFLIEPLFAKLLLPWFGGTAAVWITCLVFYQLALLAGYLYADTMTRYASQKLQRWMQTALLGSALLLLPAIPGPAWRPSSSELPVWRLFAILSAVLGLPFFLLSTTGPLLQAWSRRESPYRLYALSNAGALVALIAYPLCIEPNFSTRRQDMAWSFGFAAFALMSAIAAWTGQSKPLAAISRPSPRSLITWFTLAAGGSMLLLATTNQLTQNLAAVPFLWVLPLAVYLVTLILCFDHPRWYKPQIYTRVLVFGFATVAYTIYDIQLSTAIFIAIPVFLFGLFAGCMFCHGELSALKPAKDALTAFYLMIAAGGAAGALFVGLIAPLIFSGVYELAASMLFVSGIALWLNWSRAWSARLLWVATAITMAIVCFAQVFAYHRNALVLARNFYGSLRVTESNGVRRLYHGTIEHGAQFLDPERRRFPTTYYAADSGVGLAMRLCCSGPKRVGVVGLGTGTLAAYGTLGDIFRFYELDPEVIRLAESQFWFLNDTHAAVAIVGGDARISLQHESPQNFDVLAIDAFSGDAIPVHLLTQEAFAIYRRHLKPSGVLAIHVSNQFLDLAPVVAQLAPGAVEIESKKDDARAIAAATWVLWTANREFLSRGGIANAAQSIPPRRGRPWTDDFSNLFEVLKW